jgi:hypothetical protein
LLLVYKAYTLLVGNQAWLDFVITAILFSYLLKRSSTVVANTQLPLLSTIEEVYNSSSNLSWYCDDIEGTVPSLRQFSLFVVTNTILRHQVI